MATQNLRDRATQATGNEVAQRQEPRPATLAQMIDQMRPEIARALPKHMDPDRLARIALTVLRQTPALSRCTPASFLGALMTASQLGLEPGPLGECYFVPYGDSVTFIPGYRGLVKLAWQSGQLVSIRAETVHERDAFAVRYGSDPGLTHERPALGEERGKSIGWYALAKLKGGGEAFVVMDRNEVETIRARSRAKDSGPWKTDYDAMAKKTCVRQLAKWLPMSPELSTALAQDGQVRTDASADALHSTAGDYFEPTDPQADSEPTVIDGELVDENGVLHDEAPEAAAP